MVAGAGLLLAVVLVVLAWPRSDGSADRRELVATPIVLPLIGSSGTWELSDQQGTPVIVNFWASWCAPCRTEMPDIDALVRGSGGALRAVGVNILDQPDAAERFAAEIGVSYPLVADRRGDVAQAYDVTAVPYTVVVDAAGVIRARASGRPDAAALEALVTESLGEGWRTPAS